MKCEFKGWFLVTLVRGLPTLLAVGALSACGGGGGGGVGESAVIPAVSAASSASVATVVTPVVTPVAVDVAASSAVSVTPAASSPPAVVTPDATPPVVLPGVTPALIPEPTTTTQLSLTGLTPSAAQTGNAAPTLWRTQGAWGPVMNWPLLPLHAVMLPDGRLLTYGTEYGQKYADIPLASNTFRYDVWTPSLGADIAASHMVLPNGTNVNAFCSAQIVLPQSGTVALFGGDTLGQTDVLKPDGSLWYSFWSNRTLGNASTLEFTPGTLGAKDSIRTTASMAYERWYASPTTLLNGEVLIQGGMKQYVQAGGTVSVGAFDAEKSGGVLFPEVRQADGTFRVLSNVDTNGLDWYYPRNWVLPSGKVFGFDGWGRMYRIDAAGNGALERFTGLDLDRVTSGVSRAQSSVMYAPGQILGVGGGYKNVNPATGAVTSHTNGNQAFTIDATAATPVVTKLTAKLSAQRIWVNSTVLPDGRVAVTGGSSLYDSSLSSTQPVVLNPDVGTTTTMAQDEVSIAKGDIPTHMVRQVDLWNPTTKTFTTGASEVFPRLYHSTALLLPDGTVLSGGGGTPGPRYGTDAQIYFPPYLFTADGSPAARPIIKGAPASVAPGTAFDLQVADAGSLARVTLVKTPSVTHSNNFDQRLIEPTFTASSSTGLRISLPAAGQTPPGYYMVFVIDKAGVPSLAKILRIEIAVAGTLRATRPSGRL